MKTTVNKYIVQTAIEKVNKEHGYQITLNRADYTGKWFNFTLASPSKVSGARVSISGRNLPCASWHAHGYVFDEIFKLIPDAIIMSCGKKITKEAGNWEDISIGAGIYFSDTSIF